MTLEEIKQTVTMKDVLSRYGVEVKGNTCCCPIHKERHPSMQIFKDGYKCHACQAHGDIFAFIQEMEGCDFKMAFKLLGGTYQHENETERKLKKAKYQRDKGKRDKEAATEKEFRKRLDDAIYKCKLVIAHYPVFSDGWCEAQNSLQWLEYVWDLKYLDDEEISRADVIRVCKRVERIRAFG